MAAITTPALQELSPQKVSVHSHAASARQYMWRFWLPCLTLATLLIHGYHPLAEDGGLYVAGIEYLLHPSLFPHYTAFVTAHLHYSIFASTIAILVRITHLPLVWTLLLVYAFSIWLTLYASMQILRRCVTEPVAQLAGISLLAAWATIPVAGTSLLLMDPYLTARSISTPLSLLAIAFAMDDWQPRTTSRPSNTISKAPALCGLCLLLAALFHPLMASYAIAMVLTLRLLSLQRPAFAVTLLAVVAIGVAAVLHTFAPAESPDVTAATISRHYWFLSQWQWYELCGLVGPFCILFLISRSALGRISPPVRSLCAASLTLGSIATLIDILFAHESSPTHLVARLQPLRGFLLIYALMTLLVGATLTQRLYRSQLRYRALIPAALILNAGIMFYAQRATFPASQHIELPWLAPANPWSRAFVWIRTNTSSEALFALDTNYITTSGEDAQTFRATALRSSLPDFSKDGGEASITPTLAELWQQGAHVQSGLSAMTDIERDARLTPLGVTWMVLHADAVTAHPCPYSNGVVKVCLLPAR